MLLTEAICGTAAAVEDAMAAAVAYSQGWAKNPSARCDGETHEIIQVAKARAKQTYQEMREFFAKKASQAVTKA